MTARRTISEHGELDGLALDDHAQYALLAGRAGGQTLIGGTLTTQALVLQDNVVDANQVILANALLDNIGNKFKTGHVGISRDPTDTHNLIITEIYTTPSGPGTIIGLGNFNEFAPATSGNNTLVAVQGNAWFQTSNWGVGSTVRCLDFFPAPAVAGSAWGSANLNLYGINTAGLLNVLNRAVVADTVTAISLAPIAGLFGNDNSTVNIVRGIHIGSPVATTGTWGRLCGLQIDPMVGGTINQGLWLAGNNAGGDLVLGTGSNARIFYDGSRLRMISDDVINLGTSASTTHGLGAGDVLMGGALEVDGITYHDGNGVFYSGWIASDNAELILGSGLDSYLKWSLFGSVHRTVFALDATSKQIVFTLAGNRNQDFDHAVQAHPTQFMHSALNPTTDNGEYLGFSYLGLQAGEMETDRAKFDLTLRAVSALPGATVNQDGGIINLVPGKNALGGGVDGVVRIWHPDEGAGDYIELKHTGALAAITAGSGDLYFFAGNYAIFTDHVTAASTNTKDLGRAAVAWRAGYFGENALSGIYFGTSQTSRIWYDQSGTDTLQVGGTKQLVVNTGIMTRLTAGACVESGDAFYFGDPAINGTWRIIRDNNDLSFQRREAGTYVEKGAFTAV